MEQVIIKNTKGDKVIWACVLVLALISMLVVYSSTGMLAFKDKKGDTEYYLFRQVAFISIGLAFIYFCHRINYKFYLKVSRPLYVVSLGLLLWTLFFGVSLNEGTRWIKLPIINLTIQSSDVAKLALYIYLSRGLSKYKDYIKDFKKAYLPLIGAVLLTCMLIAPANLSTALLTGVTSMILLFIGRVSFKHLLVTAGIIAIPVVILITVAIGYYDKEEGKMKDLPAVLEVSRIPTWIKRVQSFIYADQTSKDDSYQTDQAKIAIAKGGITGVGPGNSEGRNFLPHPYSDFIYAIIVEEYGIIGGVVIVLIYLIFLYRCIRIYQRCPGAFGAFLALALSFSLVIQAFANMAVTVNIFPVTGVTLPLVSMGGSSFIITCMSIGIILSVSRNVESELENMTAANEVANGESTK